MFLQRKIPLDFDKKCNLYYLAVHNSHFRYQSLPSLPFVQSIPADLFRPFDPVNRKDQKRQLDPEVRCIPYNINKFKIYICL